MDKYLKVLKKEKTVEKEERYIALMVLAAIGDTMGYKNSNWEFQTNGEQIHKELGFLTNNKGIKNLKIDKNWIYSDDTVMHIATAEALLKVEKDSSKNIIGKEIAKSYKDCFKYMKGRAPGNRTSASVRKLKTDGSNWDKLPFVKMGGGCGGAMRSACIGLFYNKKEDLEKLIEVAIESGRITHNSPVGYLGAFTSSYFTHLAINGVSINKWGGLLFSIIPKLENYIKKSKRDVEQNLSFFKYFFNKWEVYMKLRKLSFDINIDKKPIFPEKFGIKEREKFINNISANGWGGACGHDSVIIAYDSLLGCNEDWEELCLRAVLHGGDNDSTGTIAAAWFGAMYGFKEIPEVNYTELENVEYIFELSKKIFEKNK